MEKGPSLIGECVMGNRINYQCEETPEKVFSRDFGLTGKVRIRRLYDNLFKVIYHFVEEEPQTIAVEVVVSDAERGKGIGTMTFAQFLDDMKEYDIKLLAIEERVDWFKRMGFYVYKSWVDKEGTTATLMCRDRIAE